MIAPYIQLMAWKKSVEIILAKEGFSTRKTVKNIKLSFLYSLESDQVKA